MKNKFKLMRFLEALFSCADEDVIDYDNLTKDELIQHSILERIKALKHKAESNINPNEQSR